WHPPLLPECARGRRHSALDVGLGSVTSPRHFVVPSAILVLVRDARRVSRDDLLLRRALGRFACHVVGREGLGEPPIDPIGPTAVVLDDLICDLGHASLLTLMNRSIVGPPRSWAQA